MSRARPTDRAVLPVPLASISHVARTARPQVSPALATNEWLRRLAGLRGALAGLLQASAAAAPTGSRPAKRPLTCSFGRRTGRQSC